jgi:hypothetical protein
VPLPATGFRWFNEQKHLTLEDIRGKPAKHSLGEERPVPNERFEDPLVCERTLNHVNPLNLCTY